MHRRRRASCTPKRRRLLLEALASGKRVELAAHAAGVSRRTAFAWKAEDPELAAEWDVAYDAATDLVEETLFDKAMQGDTVAGIFLMRSRRPAVYNPTLLLRLQMLELAKAKAAAEAVGVPMMERTAEGKMPADLRFIDIIAMPWNARGPSPHCTVNEWDELGPIVPVEQDGSGLRMPLPRSVFCELHWAENLPSSLMADGKHVAPQAATDLWRRIKAWNQLLATAYPESVREDRPRGYADAIAADTFEDGDDEDEAGRPDDSENDMRGFGGQDTG
jgi:hypothetical protein